MLIHASPAQSGHLIHGKFEAAGEFPMDDQTDDQKNQADQKKRRDRRQHFERDQVGEFHLDVKRFHEWRQSLGGKQRNKETRQGDQHGECSSEKPQSTPH